MYIASTFVQLPAVGRFLPPSVVVTVRSVAILGGTMTHMGPGRWPDFDDRAAR